MLNLDGSGMFMIQHDSMHTAAIVVAQWRKGWKMVFLGASDLNELIGDFFLLDYLSL